ncbi:MAG: hypothetical protein JWP80_1799 [Pseudomonas sp.]|nr:hypothetical protein [Pseudomonas sp.]
MWLVAGEHEELAAFDESDALAQAHAQATFEDVYLFAPALGIGFRAVDLARLQAELPQLHFAFGDGFGQQHGFAAWNEPGPCDFVDAARIAHLRRLDQITEGDVQRFRHPVQGREADVFLAGLNGDQHAPTDPGLFRQRALTEVRRIAQTAHVLADVLQHGRSLRTVFVHYIARLIRFAQYTAHFRCIVRPASAIRKRPSPVNAMKSTRLIPSISKAEAVLILITMVWGGTFLLVQHALSYSGPLFFVGLRFAAAASMVALFSLHILRDLTLLEFRAGVFIGTSIMLGYGLQTIGLQTIPSSQSAFITALYVPFVPLLQWLVLGRRPGLMPSLGIGLAFAGLMLLSGPNGASLNFSPGEMATLVSAVAIAAEIILIGAYAGKVDVRRVTVVQLATASVLSFLLVGPTGEALPDFSWLLVISAVGLGAASAVIQLAINWAQKTVSPTRATVIYAGEPVWAGIVGRLAGERLPGIALFGAVLIVAGVIVSEMKGRKVVAVEEEDQVLGNKTNSL